MNDSSNAPSASPIPPDQLVVWAALFVGFLYFAYLNNAGLVTVLNDLAQSMERWWSGVIAFACGVLLEIAFVMALRRAGRRRGGTWGRNGW